ncbi:MAG TPA: choice-of-anchor Q domain-containing protein [Sporichthyaceae bacterium]|jgi:hypothetical protein
MGKHRRGRLPRRAPLVAAVAAAIGAGFLVLPGVISTANAANPLTLYVTADGFDGPNDCTLSGRPCRTLRHALQAAAGSRSTGRNVVITVGPGRYVPNSVTDHIASGTPTSLTITGAGPTQTVLTMPPATSGDVVGLSIGHEFTGLVNVSSLSISGDAPAADSPGGTGGFATGIADAGPGLLTLADVRIDGLTGGHGAAATAATMAGGEGGSVYGIDRTNGPTALRNTVITALHGGGAGVGTSGGGNGGGATGVSTDSALTVTSSTISHLVGGDGANSGDGGNAYSAAVEPGPSDHPVTVIASEFSDNVGGAGGAGLRGPRGVDGANGGQGGDGVGLVYVGPKLVVADSTLSGHHGGPGGAGGHGGDATGNAGAGGVGGQGGSAMGLLSNTQDGLASTAVSDSTISDNRPGAGGAGGAGGTGRTGRGGDGGDGGAAGAGAGLMPLVSRNGMLSNTVTHLTLLGNLGATGGAAGKAGNGLAPGVDGIPGANSSTAAGFVSNAWTTMSASLLDNGAANCVLLANAPLTDGGWNIASDRSCIRAGQGSQWVPGVGGGVGAPTDNGGPTHTQAIPGTSPAAGAVAVSSGLCGGTEATDQRGMPRPGHAAPDHCAAGAFEPHRVIPGGS